MAIYLGTVLDIVHTFDFKNYTNDEMHKYLQALLSMANFFRVEGEISASDDLAIKTAERSYKRVIELSASDYAWFLFAAADGEVTRIKEPMGTSAVFDYYTAQALCGLAMIAVRRGDSPRAVANSMAAMEVCSDSLSMVHTVRLAAMAKGMDTVLYQLARHVFVPRVPQEHRKSEMSIFNDETQDKLNADIADDERLARAMRCLICE